MIRRSVGYLAPRTSTVFICDIQEKFRNNIQYFADIVSVSKRLIQASQVLDVDLVITEQYPQGLGHIVPELSSLLNNQKIYNKTQFSMCLPEVCADNPSLKSVIICGIEAHACVLQTAMDFIEKEVEVHVVVDAVSSRSMLDRKYALTRMRQMGCFLTTSECVLLQLCRGSHHPKFKDIQKIILKSAPTSGLLNWSSES